MNTASVRRKPDASAVRRFRSTDTAPVLAIALPSRAWTARCLVLLGALILMPKIAIADDPCEMPVKHVKAVAAALGKAAPPGSKPGRFEVRTISFTNEPDKFQVSYLIDGRPVFSQRLEKRDEISEHFVAGVSRNLPSVLDLSYAFGARGAISCEYKIARAQTGFVIRKTK